MLESSSLIEKVCPVAIVQENSKRETRCSMQIGKPIRAFVVQPLESVVLATEPDEGEPGRPTQGPENEPQQQPIEQ